MAVTPALAVRLQHYGCGCGLKECCCIVWSPQGDVYACCPRDGSGPCYGGKVPRVAATVPPA
jgi:hypothetical protein